MKHPLGEKKGVVLETKGGEQRVAEIIQVDMPCLTNMKGHKSLPLVVDTVLNCDGCLSIHFDHLQVCLPSSVFQSIRRICLQMKIKSIEYSIITF